jgi:uncharacterized protein DUF2490
MVSACEEARDARIASPWAANTTVRGGAMRVLRTLARYLVAGGFAIVLLSLAAPVAAQDVDTPSVPGAPDTPDRRGSIFAPSTWVVVDAPVQQRVDLKLYAFYVGDLNAPVVQADVPIRINKLLTVTPSYMYYSVPPSGLIELTPQARGAIDSYDEQQFRVDGTVAFTVDKFEISGRGMYVRRFRPGAAEDINRYRGKVAVAHPITVGGSTWKPFAAYEAYYEPQAGGWNRDRIWSGITLPVSKHVMFQPSYMWETSQGSPTVNYLLFGLILNPK